MTIEAEVGLRQLSAKLEAVSNGQLLAEISQNLAESAIDLVKEGFAREEDPYGSPWAPLQHREGKILQDTGRLKNSFTPGSSGPDGFRFGSNVQYAEFHQQGTGRLPARKMVPDGSELPDAWLREFTSVTDEILADYFGQ